MSAPGKSIEERLHFIKHKGHAIYVIDFTHCAEKEMLLLLDMVRADIARHEPHSMLTLADFTGAEVDKNVATRIKEVLVLDLYEHFKNFSQRDLPTFKTREEAMDWLVQD